jgi:hypothetical protein
MFGMPFLGLAEAGIFVYVLDKNGKKHKVKVKSEAHRKKLLAQNKEMITRLNKKAKKNK